MKYGFHFLIIDVSVTLQKLLSISLNHKIVILKTSSEKHSNTQKSCVYFGKPE